MDIGDLKVAIARHFAKDLEDVGATHVGISLEQHPEEGIIVRILTKHTVGVVVSLRAIEAYAGKAYENIFADIAQGLERTPLRQLQRARERIAMLEAVIDARSEQEAVISKYL